jgi:hypothetical protein
MTSWDTAKQDDPYLSAMQLTFGTTSSIDATKRALFSALLGGHCDRSYGVR